MSDFYTKMLAAVQREKDLAPVPIKESASLVPKLRKSSVQPVFGAAISGNAVAVVAVTPLIETWRLVVERCAFVILPEPTQAALRSLAKEFDAFVVSARLKTLYLIEPRPAGTHRAVGMTHLLHAMLLLRPGLEVVPLPERQVSRWRTDARKRIPRPQSLDIPPRLLRQTGFELHDRASACATFASQQLQQA